MKTIGIVGSRRRDSKEDLSAFFEVFGKVYKEGDRLVSGGCPKGGDRFAEIVAKQMGLTITIHYPDWDKYGKSAGFKRNTNIAEDADVLIAIVAEDRKGGTEDTIKKAEKLGKQIILVE
jgi:predicted  nucleic acid-binding Zn-ribbon protein